MQTLFKHIEASPKPVSASAISGKLDTDTTSLILGAACCACSACCTSVAVVAHWVRWINVAQENWVSNIPKIGKMSVDIYNSFVKRTKDNMLYFFVLKPESFVNPALTQTDRLKTSLLLLKATNCSSAPRLKQSNARRKHQRLELLKYIVIAHHPKPCLYLEHHCLQRGLRRWSRSLSEDKRLRRIETVAFNISD